MIEAVLGITVPPIQSAQTAHESTSASVGSLVLEGHGFLNRLPLTLMSGSVAIIQGRDDVEWYLPSFIPGLDYVPVAHDLRDLLSKSGYVVQGVLKGEWMPRGSSACWIPAVFELLLDMAGVRHVITAEELLWYRCCRQP